MVYLNVSRILRGLATGCLFSVSVIALAEDESAVENGANTASTHLNASIGKSVILPAMERLAAASMELEANARVLERSPTPANFDKFVAQYHEVSEYREMLRAFEFGPTHSLGFSTLYDTPVDTGAIDTLLSSESLFYKHVVNEGHLLQSMQGFATIDFIISSWQSAERGKPYNDRQRQYLVALTRNLSSTALAMHNAWFGSQNDPAAYNTVLSTAGAPDNPAYQTVNAGSEELVRASINTLAALLEEGLAEYVEPEGPLLSLPQQTSNRRIRGAINGVVNSFTGRFFPVMDVDSAYTSSNDTDQQSSLLELSRQSADGVESGLAPWLSTFNTDASAMIESELVAALSIADSLARESTLQVEEHALLTKELTGKIEQVQQQLESEVLPLTQAMLSSQ